ncbi:MAG: TetR/AcrR family transcriptional regulator [bacterium]|nr:TetR/AcrR family transcriptional regulator [bacterium]
MKKTKSTHSRTGERKRSIIEAALECFTEIGYDETGIADICERSKASVGSLYHHFGSKEQIAAAVYLEGIKVFQTGLLEVFKQDSEPLQGITDIVRFHLTWVSEHMSWSQFLFQRRRDSFMSGTDEELDELNKEFIKGLSAWFMRHIQSGKIRKMGWDIYVSILLGPCQEFSRIHMTGRTISSIDDAVRDISFSVWRALEER